ncbi:MAG TPA: efflux transporter outer membrane subunit [Candidatus Sulfotelmatobacter sp.]|nr:efflux transporter outer membrane subunit [Candidatus Sulfotelmatobacter sp.]
MRHSQTRQPLQRNSSWSLAAVGVCVLCSVMLVGCVVGPKYHQPSAPIPDTYKESPANFPEAQNWKVAAPQDAMLRGKWWEIFHDPELNALEDQLDTNNQNIKQAYENYMAARAIIREVRAQYFPTASTSPAISRSHASSNLGGNVGGGGVSASASGKDVNSFSLPGDVSWEPDLWGKIRNTVNQARYAAQVSAADLENIRLSQHASVAQLFFQVRGQDALQKLFNDTVLADRKIVEYAQAQYEVGVGDRISLVEAQSAMQSAEASAISVGINRAQYEHAIAVLLGKPPAELSIPTKPLDAVPPTVPIGVPSHLLERRPDVAAAERLMAEANAQIGIAYAAYYPSITLSASGGFQSSSFTNWLTWPSRFWSIGATASETIFDAGLRRATVNQFVATYNADLASYRQTVLIAFQQVEDYLAAERILSQQTDKQKEAVASAQEFFTLEFERYQIGIDPYINVLTAQNTLLTDQQALANLQTQRMTSAVQLIAALGGGWEKSDLPSPAQVSEKAPPDATRIQQ